MSTCEWCGDPHGVDQLCQRGQRGMTRRSFCFLFGAGVAGAVLVGINDPDLAWEFSRPVVLQPDKWTMIKESIYGPTIANFRTRERLPLGKRIAIDYQGQRLFEGVLMKTESYPGLTEHIENVAQDSASFYASRFRPA